MSVFFYGHNITTENNLLPFNDGEDKNATLKIGDYTLTEFVAEVQRALNDASTITFTVSVVRSTRIITIAGDSNFGLNTTSGSIGNCFSLLGFEGADKSGASSYVGTLASGSEFKPQFKLQKFVNFGDEVSSIYSSVARSANGTIETVSFGDEEFMSCVIAYQTNIPQSGGPIENQTNGLDNLRTFLQYITKKRKIEICLDRDSVNSYFKCILESTEANGNGTGYKLKEYFGSHMGYFSSGNLKFRKVL